MLLPKRPGISLKISAMVSLMIVGEMVLLAWLLDTLGDQFHTALILSFVGGALIAGLVLAAALDWLVTRPLLNLVIQVRALPERGYGVPLVPSGVDEPRELGEALEHLRQLVVSREEQLTRLNQELEARVVARTDELRRAQDQLLRAEKLASVGQLAGGVAHEVNNPTGVILARASYLVSVADDEGMDPDVIEDLEVIVQQAERIRTITGDLLAFARRSDSARATVDLVEVCELARSLLKHSAVKARVTVEVVAAGPVTAVGQRDALEQVVSNLLKNAVEAAPADGRVEARLVAGEGDVTLQVDDSGPGVATEHRDRVFDPFFTTKPVGQGAGLGLSVVYGIVEDHRGSIHVTDSPLGGARFVVRLPAADPPGSPEGAPC
ncbi:MAG: ATP-binding protein [Pseudomonadota bacterium]